MPDVYSVTEVDPESGTVTARRITASGGGGGGGTEAVRVPSDDGIEMRIRSWENIQRSTPMERHRQMIDSLIDQLSHQTVLISTPPVNGTFTVPRDTPLQTQSEVLRELREEARNNVASRNALNWRVAEARYDFRYPDEEPLHRNYSMSNLPEYIETQKQLADEAKERLNDAKRAGARDYDRTKWVQTLGDARQAVEKKHEELLADLTFAAGPSFPRIRAKQVTITDDCFVVSGETLLGLERDLAEAQYRWHVAEMRLAEEHLQKANR